MQTSILLVKKYFTCKEMNKTLFKIGKCLAQTLSEVELQ